MNLELTAAQASELERLITAALSDLSHEIADTEHPEFRRELALRRQHLVEVVAALQGLLQSAGVGTSGLEREIAHPGG